MQLEKISYTYQLTLKKAIFAFVSTVNTDKNRNNNKQESDDKEESKEINLPPSLEYQGTNHSKARKYFTQSWSFILLRLLPLRISYVCLARVVRKVDIQRIAWFVLLTLIHWVAIHPVDSVIYSIHFEITGYPCNVIGSQRCDLFTNRTIFCSKSHLFLSQ